MVEPITKLDNFDFGEIDVPEYVVSERLPEGIYNVTIEHVGVGSNSDPRTFVIVYRVLDGAFKGRKISDFFNIYKSKQSAIQFKIMLQILGFSSTEITLLGRDINNMLDAIVGLNLRVKTVKNGDFINVEKRNKPIEPNGTGLLQKYKDKQDLLAKTTSKGNIA